MNSEQTYTKLIQELRDEIKEKDEIIRLQNEQLDAQKFSNEGWVHAKNFSEAIEEAKEMKKKYEEAYREIIKLKASYLGALQEMIDNF